MRAVLVVVLVAAAGLAGLAGCASVRPLAGGVVHAVAAENPWGDILAQVGGSHVAVTSLIGSHVDPHEWEGTARDAATVFRADLVVENGLGYDQAVDDLVQSAPRDGRRTVVVADVLGVHSADANPHLWYDVGRVPTVARAFAATLSALDPAHRADYAANADRFVAALAPVDAVVATIRARFAGRAVGYTERVPGYLLAAAGLRLGTPAAYATALEDGVDPSPAAVRDFDAAISEHRIKALLVNRQVVDAGTDAAAGRAAQSGIPVVGVTETIPAAVLSAAGHFQDWQLAQDRALLAALTRSAA